MTEIRLVKRPLYQRFIRSYRIYRDLGIMPMTAARYAYRIATA